MQSHNYSVTVLLDGSAAAMDYGVSGVPMAFFIGRDGIIKYVKLGAFSSLSDMQNDLNKID